jgi:hypothetical protein
MKRIRVVLLKMMEPNLHSFRIVEQEQPMEIGSCLFIMLVNRQQRIGFDDRLVISRTP